MLTTTIFVFILLSKFGVIQLKVYNNNSIISKTSFAKWWPYYEESNYTIPENFDAREAWPECKNIISMVKDQGRCAFGWAHCATMVMNDRLCIVTKGTEFYDFSMQDLITCCEECSNKPWCTSGGYALQPFVYLAEHGLVSTMCKRYDVTKMERLPRCLKSCRCRSQDYIRGKIKASHYGIIKSPDTTIKQIQIEIMLNGPICSQLELRGDHFEKSYTTGVYVEPYPPPDVPPAGHLVKIFGWGTENGVDYWLGANSLGRSWGENGYFKIRRGTNELSVETLLTTGMMRPLKDSANKSLKKNFLLFCMAFLLILQN